VSGWRAENRRERRTPGAPLLTMPEYLAVSAGSRSTQWCVVDIFADLNGCKSKCKSFWESIEEKQAHSLGFGFLIEADFS
jgi:hypothetical protein